MAVGRGFFDMIKGAPEVDVEGEVEIEIDKGAGYVWQQIYTGNYSIAGGPDELIFNAAGGANIEFTQNVSGDGTVQVRAIRASTFTASGGRTVFPETTFTAISVPFESTLRFTEIKLSL